MKPQPLGLWFVLTFLAACGSAQPESFYDQPTSSAGTSSGAAGGGASGAQAGATTAGRAGTSLGGSGGVQAMAGAAGRGGAQSSGGGGSGSCAAERAAFASHCYGAAPAPATWETAKNACQEQGAHLVTIGSEEENSFVWALIGEEQWLGASDGKEQYDPAPGTYTWVTGEPLKYAKWSDGQPNTTETDCPGDPSCFEHCAFQWQGGEWNDRYCGHEIRYVCEWE